MKISNLALKISNLLTMVLKETSIWFIAPISATLFWLLFNVEKKLTQLRKIKIDYEFKIINYKNLINSQGVKVEDKLSIRHAPPNNC